MHSDAENGRDRKQQPEGKGVMTQINSDFSLEKRLSRLDPELHRRFTDAVPALKSCLTRYQTIFPGFTDHTILHSLTVIDFCNRLIGSRIDRLNADEIFILLMGCHLHDAGMGITRKDYERFSAGIDFGGYFETHDRNDVPEIIRSFHNEFSGQFIRKYARLFEIPSPEHEQAIVQVARGHRKTDLMDGNEYPAEFRMPNGNVVCLPYLAALIRLADEIDVAMDRNPSMLYDIGSLTNELDINEFEKARAVRSLRVSDDAFTLEVGETDARIMEQVRLLVLKMQKTLDYCRAVVNGRTPYAITQEKVLIRESAAPA